MATAAATANPASDQALLESTARTVIAQGLLRMSDYVADPKSDIEVVVKIVNSAAKDIGKVIPEKKLDPFAGLATLHLTFVNGSVHSRVEGPPPPLELVDEVRADLAAMDALPAAGFEPTMDQLAWLGVNADLAGLEVPA